MKKWNKQEDIERELSRILSEVHGISRDIAAIEEAVESTANCRVEPLGSTDLDFEYLKFKARRTLRQNQNTSGSLS